MVKGAATLLLTFISSILFRFLKGNMGRRVTVEIEIKIMEILFVLAHSLSHTQIHTHTRKILFLLATFFCLCHSCWNFWTSIFAFHHYWEGPTQQLHSNLIADLPLRLEETLLSGLRAIGTAKPPVLAELTINWGGDKTNAWINNTVSTYELEAAL